MKGINTKRIRKELDEMANPPLVSSSGDTVTRGSGKMKVSVKLDRNITSRVSLYHYEQGGVLGLNVLLNPTKVRSQKQLDEALAFAREWCNA